MNIIDTAFNIETIALEQDNIILVTAGALFKLDKNNELSRVADFFKYGSRNYEVADNKTYCLVGRDLYSSDIGEHNFSKLDSNFGIRFALDGDNVAGIDYSLNTSFLKDGIYNFISFSHSIKSNGNRFGVLRDNALYVIDQWGVLEAYLEDKSNTDPRNGVFKLDLITIEVQDITYKLPCLNRLGNPFGAIGDLVWHDNHLVVSTDQGVFKLVGEEWVEILDNWGVSQLFTLSNDELLAITLSGNYHVFNLLRGDDWIDIGKVERVKGLTLRNVVLRGNTIYVNRGINNLITIDISNVQIPTYNKPQLAKYLNVADITAACEDGDKVYIAGKEVYEIVDGNAQQVYTLGTDVLSYALSIVPFNGDIAVATSKELRLIKSAISTSLDSYRVRLCTEENTIFCLSNRQLIVFDENLSVIASGDLYRSKKIDEDDEEEIILHDYISDIAVKNGIIYAIGFNNGKYTNIPVQVAFLNKYKIENAEIVKIDEKVWGFNPQDLGQNLADTRAYNIEFLDDDHVVVVCEQAGGDGILRFNGQDLETSTVIITDIYDDTRTGKTRSAHILWYGVINIHTNEVIRGRFAIPRNDQSQMVSSSNRARALHISNGNICIGSLSGYKMPRRDNKFNGEPIAPYRGGDASMLSTTADLAHRDWFTPGNGEVLLYTGKHAVIATDSRGDLPTKYTVGDEPTDVYFVKW